MSAFLEGFYKRAAAKQPPAEEATPQPSVEAPLPPGAADPTAMAPMEADRPEMLLKWNHLGGVDPRSPEALQAAEASDLITLPEGVEGTNCSNCKFVRLLDPAVGHGFCTNPAVQQDVTPRMCCALWDAAGAHRAWEAVDQATMIPDAGMLGEADAMANGQMPMDGGAVDPVTGEPMDPAAAGGEAPAPTGEMEGPEDGSEQPENTSPGDKAPEKKKKPAPKKKDGGGGANTINIHVGHGGAEKKAGLPGLAKNDVTKVVMERFRQRAGRMLRGARKPTETV